jgi:hypothetical protein
MLLSRLLRKSALRLAISVLLLTSLQALNAQVSLPLTLGCVWPFETTPDTLNVMYPDSNAIYWTTPFITLPGSRLQIEGDFFPARFLSINTYNTLGASITSTYDIKFPLDSGSQNPYTTPSATGGSFHLTIEPQPAGGGMPPDGVVYGPPINQYGFSQGYVVLRSYIHTEKNVKPSELPKITVSLNGFKLATLSPCTTLSPSIRLLLFNALVRYWDGNYNAPGATDPTDKPMFRPPSSDQANGAFPNDYNKYIVTGINYQKGQLVVIRGKAPKVPPLNDNGYPTLGSEDLRYWSLCNYDHVFPFPVVKDGGCAADDETIIDKLGYYTYVVAAKADTPKRKDPVVTPINWGVTAVSKALILRNMLPVNGFYQTAQVANKVCQSGDVSADAKCTAAVMRDYYPRSVYCSKSVYEQGGWEACFSQQE